MSTLFCMHTFFVLTLIFNFYLFLVVLGLHCCSWAFSSPGKLWLLFVEVHGLLTAEASLVSTGPRHTGFSRCSSQLISCGSWALVLTGSEAVAQGLQLPCGMWNPPGPGIKSVSPTLAGRFSSTVPPGRSCMHTFLMYINHLVVKQTNKQTKNNSFFTQ